jgi:hypothetical protein
VTDRILRCELSEFRIEIDLLLPTSQYPSTEEISFPTLIEEYLSDQSRLPGHTAQLSRLVTCSNSQVTANIVRAYH